ncbi:hypothetical protein BST96_10075 [Oceanicoccus sagamiensis]|uniref:NAD(P)-binding domain-containing protein n=1 Tax=Oceanicoccus sagamiensis TaxID=716816 RepID=A0A1X9NKN6_9GAMM|nr:hypothetical protein BST96_10075 [Oceanicoccus sagamiensis]
MLIFGASKGTGLETARLLSRRGDTVTAFVRPSSDITELKAINSVLITGDALSPDDVAKALTGKNYDAILTTLGCFKCETPPDFIGNKNVFDAAKASGNSRVIMVSTIGVGKSDAGIPWISKKMLADIIALKSKAEDTLTTSGLEYTIIRPGALKNAPATQKGLLTEDPTVIGVITREDLATLIVQSIDSSNTIGKIYSAMDQEMVWPWGMF